MAEKDEKDVGGGRPSRNQRIDYKKLNNGGGAQAISPLREVPEYKQTRNGVGVNMSADDICVDNSDDEIISMQAELQQLEQEEERLRRRRSEAAELKEKLDRKRREVGKLRGEKVKKGPETKTTSVTLDDLRKMKKLQKRAKSCIKKSGLDIFESDDESEVDSDGLSDSSSDERARMYKSSKNKKSHKFRFVESDDESSGSSKDKNSKRKSKNKSGILSKASDRVRNKQFYPQSHLRFEFVNEGITFDKLDFNLFIAGELEIISSSFIGRIEKKERIEFLKRLMYLSSSYEFSVIKKLYAATLREIELGVIDWGDSLQYVENAVLSSFSSKKKFSTRSSKTHRNTETDSEEKIWFCNQFQRNKCVQKAPHTMVVKGKLKLAQHICASCWIKDKLKLFHPECSSSCPHAND